MSDLRTSVLLDLAGNLQSKSRSYAGALESMSKRGSRSLNMLRRSTLALGRGLDAMGSRYSSALLGAGAAYKSYRAVVASAELDKQLTRIRQTAGATKEQTATLRRELFLMSQQSGQAYDSLLGGFNNLIQSGQSWDEASATIRGVNDAMAVTGANADVLTSSITVAAQAFNFDLSKVETSTLLLDQMTVAGRLGNAELEDLSSIFARVGVNAQRAGLGFSSTLGFIEQLSLIERNPERLATLADSTLRLFTNQRYLAKAAKVTGVKFYDATGQKREAFDVLDDIAAKYKTLTSDIKRDRFIQASFGEADLDTRKGLSALLAGDAIKNARTMSGAIQDASGTIAKDLPDAIDNAVDQSARLGAALGDAADKFARPINDAVNRATRYLLDEKGLTGGQMLVGGAVAGLAGIGGAKLLGGLILSKLGGKIGGGLGGLLGGGGAPIPVYVVNNRMSMLPEAYGGGWKGGGTGAGQAVSKRGGRWSALRGAGKWAGRIGGAMALAGTAYDIYDTWTDADASTDAKVNASGRAVGGGLGGWGGAVAGAQLGAALGSIVPGLGTAIGAAIGGIGGGMAGAWAGGNLGEQLMDLLGFRDGQGERPEGRLRIEVSDERVNVSRLDSRGMDIDVDAGPYMAGVGG